MHITIVGIGMGNPDTLTVGGLRALEKAELIIGAPRIISSLPPSCTENRIAEINPSKIKSLIDGSSLNEIAVAMSGDTGFFSGTEGLMKLLEDYNVKTVCGITSVSYMASRLNRPWQNVKLVSAHGKNCDIIGSVLSSHEVFFLTGGDITPSTIIDTLVSSGLGSTDVTVGTNLSYPDESIVNGIADNLSGMIFPPLSAVWVSSNISRLEKTVSSGLPDEVFIRGSVPMTKQEVRAAVLSKLRVKKADTVYDIGAGTGSVSVELALLSPDIRVFAVECSNEACGLIEENRRKFSAFNLTVVKGSAPEVLEHLPSPGCAFIGGSGGKMRAILSSLLVKRNDIRVVISAIALETLGEALAALKELSFTGIDIVQISVSRSKSAGSHHLMTGQNPIFLISAEGGGA